LPSQISRKAHLEFDKEDRKRLRDELLREWKYSKHYVNSAINSVIGLVKGWITVYNGGKAKGPPKITQNPSPYTREDAEALVKLAEDLIEFMSRVLRKCRR